MLLAKGLRVKVRADSGLSMANKLGTVMGEPQKDREISVMVQLDGYKNRVKLGKSFLEEVPK